MTHSIHTTHSTHSTDTTREAIRDALQASYGLTLLKDVLDDAVGQAMRVLFRLLTDTTDAEPDPQLLAQAYSATFLALAQAVNDDLLSPALPDAWQAHLVSRIVDSVNPWSRQAERVDVVAPGIHGQAQRDLRILHALYALKAHDICELTRHAVADLFANRENEWVPWSQLVPEQVAPKAAPQTARSLMLSQLARASDWGAATPLLEHYWRRYGTGIFARYSVLRWDEYTQNLQGVVAPDTIQLANLIGYEREKARLRLNLERFVQGLPAHDAVLYGAPGTGKSATVKALANDFADSGLHLVEVRKESVNDLPMIIHQLRGHAPYFLLFIDDLSFEENETSYKALKVLLEGSVEARPANILIHATTNRLNLIRESFSDRGKPTEDIHWRDTHDEKASLVARFGLRVTFMTPDQAQFLAIATGLAHQRGITLSDENIQARALSWERQHTGRSGRVARQFIDELEAEQGLS